MRTRPQLTRHLRLHVARELFDESDAPPVGMAIYSLVDPRDLRAPRYVGQTSSPRRRFLQHLHTARLWLPDERPWWIPQPKLRPLYQWIRVLFQENGRLPTMLVHEWAGSVCSARIAERARIYESLATGLPLLNVEREILGDQWPLL